jgi:hypothetical protein
MHGGVTPIHHGLYSKYARGVMASRIEDNLAHPRLLDVRERLALLEALIQQALEKGAMGERDRDALIRMIDGSVRALAKLPEIEQGLRLSISTDTFRALVDQVAEVVRTELSAAPDLLARIAGRLRQLQSGPGGDEHQT